MIKISDTELIEEVTPTRQLAKELVADYRRRGITLDVANLNPVRESKEPRYFPVGAFQWWWYESVIRPQRGAIERELYPRK